MRHLSLIILFGTSPLVATASQTSYSIGNSLTWDAKPPTVRDLAALAGETLTVGYHIRCGSSLLAIYNDPLSTCINPPPTGLWDEALPDNVWDVVTLQPYPGGGSTLATDENVTLEMMNVALQQSDNNTTQFYIYSTYTNPNAWLNDSYHDNWLTPTLNEPTQATRQYRDYYDNLIENVRNSQPSVLPPVLSIPAGEVIDVLDQMMVAGDVPGFNDAADLFRDAFHLNNVGRYVLSHTWYATIFGASPIGLDTASLFPASGNWPTDQNITPELALQLQSVIWNVVRSHADSGVGLRGDFDGDGNRTVADVSLFVQALTEPQTVRDLYPGLDLSIVGDVNEDDTFDLGDIAAFNALLGGPASAASVPEPSALLLSLLVLASVAWRRRTSA